MKRSNLIIGVIFGLLIFFNIRPIPVMNEDSRKSIHYDNELTDVFNQIDYFNQKQIELAKLSEQKFDEINDKQNAIALNPSTFAKISPASQNYSEETSLPLLKLFQKTLSQTEAETQESSYTFDFGPQETIFPTLAPLHQSYYLPPVYIPNLPAPVEQGYQPPHINYIEPYVRRDGTRVRGHYRTSPNEYKFDNLNWKPSDGFYNISYCKKKGMVYCP